MISFMAACIAAQQKGPPTTPIETPKPKVAAKPPAAKPKNLPGIKVAPRKETQRSSQPPAPNPQPSLAKYVDNPPGSGPPIRDGEIVTIRFLVRKQGNQDVADSKRRGLPYAFKLGAPGNDPLLDLVVKGMRAGGTRKTTVLGRDAYGPAGAPPMISPQDTLTITVTLLHRGPP